MKFSELLEKVAGLITPTNKRRPAVIPRPSVVRDQKLVDAFLYRIWGMTVERRNTHIPTWNPNQFEQDTEKTVAAQNYRRIDSNARALGANQ